ncbi:Uncharacterised protein [Vibrio cholerae]|nr:Uncharacterised protein [Vibrio cholerae]CSB55233.1 Uncharacterised protein [Vibrio cholerae]CSB62668.1 Uncharacterised protein [Vibrio cholerae]
MGFTPHRAREHIRIFCHFQITLQHRHRCTQFMGNVSKEITAHAFELFKLSDITHHHQVFTFGVRHYPQFQHAITIERRTHFERISKIIFFEVFDKVRRTQQVRDRLPSIVRPTKTQQMLRKAVTPHDIAFAAKHHHRIGERFRTITETANKISQFFAFFTMALLQAINAIEQRLPIPRSRRWGETFFIPQPSGKANLMVQMPEKLQSRRCQQQPRHTSENPSHHNPWQVKKSQLPSQLFPC